MKFSGKKKLLIENFLVYGLGSMFNKIIPLIMLPIVTRLMPDTYYFGLTDMVNLISTFGSAIVIMGLYDAMFRLFFEKEDNEYKREICSTTAFIVIFNAVLMLIIMLVFEKQFTVSIFGKDASFVLLRITIAIIFINSLNSILAAPIRMQNRRKIFLILNFITSILGYCISVPLLKMRYFELALPISQLVAAILLFIVYYSINYKWFNLKYFRIIYIKELLKIGIPLMPTFLAYWVFNSFDRLMIKNMLGMNSVGIYAIGTKVATVSQLIYQAFAQGWQYFAFSTMKDEDNVKTISKIFEILILISTLSVMLITPFKNLVFNILFNGDYVNGHIVFPYLFLSPLLLMMFQSIGNQLIVIKKSAYLLFLLIAGVAINVAFNLLLIPLLGVKGASYSTFLGYFTTVMLTAVFLGRKRLIFFNTRMFNTLLLLFLYMTFLIIDKYIIGGSIIFLILVLYVNRKNLMKYINAIRKKKVTV